MSDELVEQKTGELVSAINQQGLGELLKPLIREIHLFDSFVAGTTHLKDTSVLKKPQNFFSPYLTYADEAHRLYTETLDKADRWVKRAKTTCIFSYDAGQMLSYAERRRNTSEKIDQLCTGHIYKLTNKIRTNKELALFITCLRDLSKFRDEYSFPNVRIVYEPDKQKAIAQAKALEEYGYTYISYTPSLYDHRLDDQSWTHNTHNVIGQEFEGVCMLLDDNFRYDERGHLSGITHPNPDYLFEQLLYQGLSRVRSKIALIITSETILQKVLPLMVNC